uniref:Uncharacterized protein n=1 Tax=Romanomermis culicivorax TaxID=13658 RepID=A0A915JBA9_ROMCU
MTSSCCFHLDRRRILVDGCSHSGITGGIEMAAICRQNRQKFKIFRKIPKIRKFGLLKTSNVKIKSKSGFSVEFYPRKVGVS